ncbi:MAG TPA: lysylphosphatidylglycerol synthetase [Rhodospirillaceae bacterium]|nr:lysylphosphatidylglycerol synthetase [Rhodospirillaceae bacterium]HAA92078.1 lysylphosphatidylglycerol synthetase [Rhodospirillaceae bacterium]HAT36483.1 lysylphosphatidylglycerol synthetase [Rhodospirillaceae bacterium]
MRKALAAFVSLSILGVIYWQIDLVGMGEALAAVDWEWFALAVAMVVPLTAMSAWRLSFLAPREAGLEFTQSLNLTLMASVLNAILPSKLGDLARSYALVEQGHMTTANALSLVVFEKAWDVLALSFWCAVGLVWMLLSVTDVSPLYWVVAVAIGLAILFGVMMVSSVAFAETLFSIALNLIPGRSGEKIAALQKAWLETLIFFWADKRNAAIIILGSLLLWLLHLCQIWLFVFALNHTVPFFDNAAMAALSIFIGLLPFTLAGIGTRDAALIFFYQPYLAAPAAAALGLFCTLRYLLPALIGLPFLGQYLATAKRIKQVYDPEG